MLQKPPLQDFMEGQIINVLDLKINITIKMINANFVLLQNKEKFYKIINIITLIETYSSKEKSIKTHVQN